MTNHLHLLLLSGPTGLASLMHPLLTGYVGAFNRRYKRVGHLVQNRFKAILCEEETYFMELVRYIHLNPVRAGIVQTFDDLAAYPWTGHAALMGKIVLPWQAVDSTLGHFGATLRAARHSYGGFLRDGWTQGERDDLEGGGLRRSLYALGGTADRKIRINYDARILGSGDFVDKIQSLAEGRERHQRAVQEAFSIDSLLALAAKTLGVSTPLLRGTDRSRSITKARALFAFAATEWLRRPGTEVQQLLRMTSSAVSAARRRGRKIAEESDFAAQLQVQRSR